MLLAHHLGIILIAHIFTGCWCLTNVKVIIPLAVRRGGRAVLRCIYDLEGDQLYSVKWYKGGREFYRYTPRENPPKKQFPIPGLEVLETESNDTAVVLYNVEVENSGAYSCEISADAPSFFTGMESGVLQVVEVPKHDPVINGLKHRYRLGEVLKAECISQGSRPAANLTWMVNDARVDPARIRRHHSRPPENGTLLNAHSALRLQITSQLYSKGRLKIRCFASLHNIYYRSSEKSVELERQRPRVSTTLSPTMNWEYALPAERNPENTFIFTAPSNGGAVRSLALWTLLSPLAVLLRCTR